MKNIFCLICCLFSLSLNLSAQPSIISVSPKKGPVGTIVTIQGSNFSTTLSNNFVYFGAVRATVLNATSTSLTVTVPKGANRQDLTITTLDNRLTAYSPYPFEVTFPGGDRILTDTTFTGSTNIRCAPGGIFTAIGDIDADGKPDLAVLGGTGGNSFYLSYHRNTSVNGSISFAPKIDTSVGGYSETGILLSDLNGDGHPELLTACDEKIYIFRNTSSPGIISFSKPQLFNFPNERPDKIEVSDMDKDGKPDVVFTNKGSLMILKNTGNSAALSFSNPHTIVYSTSWDEQNLKLGDFDLDGKVDVAYTCGNRDTFVVVRNNSTPGNLSFDVPINFFTGTNSSPRGICLGDMNDDGLTDIIVANISSHKFSIYKNRSTPGYISFEYAYGVTSLFQTQSITNGDINGDGKLDIAVHRPTFNTMAVLANHSYGCQFSFNPTGNFLEYPVYLSGNILLADINEDGKPEMILNRPTAEVIQIFKNNVSQSLRACSGSNIVIPSSISGSSYQWQINSGSGYVNLNDGSSLTGVHTPQLLLSNLSLSFNGNRFRCLVDNDTSNVFRLFVNGSITPSVAITACSYYLCSGTGTINLYAEPSNGGSSPVYEWQDSTSSAGWKTIAGANSSSLSYTSSQPGTKIRCKLTSDLGCAVQSTVNSNIITLLNLNSVTSSISITGNTNVVQGLGSLITATSANTGAFPVYQWQDSTSGHSWKNIANGNGLNLNYIPQKTGDKLRCILTTGNGSCIFPATAYSNVLKFTISSITTVPSIPANTNLPLVYPNPAGKIIILDSLQLSAQWLSVQVVSMDGRAVSQTYSLTGRTQLQIPVGHLNNAIYFLLLQRKNGSTAYYQFLKL